MKIAFISDIHYGKKNDNPILLDHYARFFNEVFFPYLEGDSDDREPINTIIIPGDLLDKRKSVNILTAKRMREDFLELCAKKTVHVIAGNHDTFFKSTNDVNSLTELLRPYPNINVYVEPTEVQIDGIKLLMLPWICQDNEKRSIEAIEKTKAQICIAHLELKGLKIREGQVTDHGSEISLFSKFDMVLTGHYHNIQKHQNIYYLGSCFEMTWAEYGHKRGFHIFDTKTRELTLIENPYKMFHMLTYNDEKTTLENLLSDITEDMKNSFVKVVVSSKTNIGWFDQYLQKLEGLPVYDVGVVDEESLAVNLDTDDDLINQAESTLEMLSKSLDYYDIEKGYKKDLNRLLEDLYKEANVLNS